MQSSTGKEIQFFRGLPAFKEDLREIDPKFNNVLVFDDLMAQATDSPLVSHLFNQRENLTRTSAGMLSTWLFSEVLAIENKSVSLRNECFTKIARDSCQVNIFKKRKERLVISSLTIAQTRRVISKY